MNLFEIHAGIEEIFANAAVDESTGEVIYDEAALDALNIDLAEKRKNIALRIRNLESFAAGIKALEEGYAKRRKATEKEAAWMRDYLGRSLNGEGFETPEVAVKFKKNPPALTWADSDKDNLVAWLIASGFAEMVETKTETKIDKKAIAAALKTGAEIPFVTQTQTTSMTIK